jgi:hypothetical protein
MPGYWLRLPELCRDPETVAAFDLLLDQALTGGPGRPVDHRLGAPKWQFLCHAAERANLVLPGSGDPGIGLFEPRQANDSFEFGNRRATASRSSRRSPSVTSGSRSPRLASVIRQKLRP